MIETLDVYDANLRHLGRRLKSDVHKEGLWHKSFHLWLISAQSQGSVLYQMRAPSKDVHPNLLDISVAGHLLAGEEILDGVREVREEIGVEVRRSELIGLGSRIEVADYSNGFKNREFQEVFFAKCEIRLDEFKPNTREVSGLIRLPVEDGIKLHSGDEKSVEVDARLYVPETKSWDSKRIEVTQKSFLPRIQNYYLTIHIMAERLLEGRAGLAIS